MANKTATTKTKETASREGRSLSGAEAAKVKADAREVGDSTAEAAKRLLMGGGGLALLLVGYFWFYSVTGIGLLCPFNEITHWHCPGCGLTRMLTALLRGEVYQAFRYNPMMFVLLPVMAVLYIENMVARMKGRPSLVDRMPQAVWIVAIVVILIYWVMRNLPWFSYLAPTELQW